MNSTKWSQPQHRFSCATAAMLASTLVLSSVLWLFASDSAPAAGASIVMVKQQPASASVRTDSRLATRAASTVRL